MKTETFNFDFIINHPYFHTIAMWAAIGLGVGIAAKLILPGSENMGWIRTICLGLAGCFLGNTVAPRLLDWPTYSTLSWQGLGLGVLGAMVLVIANRLVTKS